MLDCFFEYGLVDELVDYERQTPFSNQFLEYVLIMRNTLNNYQIIKSED
jgi:hypothetical protein